MPRSQATGYWALAVSSMLDILVPRWSTIRARKNSRLTANTWPCQLYQGLTWRPNEVELWHNVLLLISYPFTCLTKKRLARSQGPHVFATRSPQPSSPSLEQVLGMLQTSTRIIYSDRIQHIYCACMATFTKTTFQYFGVIFSALATYFCSPFRRHYKAQLLFLLLKNF